MAPGPHGSNRSRKDFAHHESRDHQVQREQDQRLRPAIDAADRAVHPLTPHLAISPTVSVVVPAMNEAENLPHVFATIPQWIDEIVLVDGNSVDDTVAVARRLRPQHQDRNADRQGQGRRAGRRFRRLHERHHRHDRR